MICKICHCQLTDEEERDAEMYHIAICDVCAYPPEPVRMRQEKIGDNYDDYPLSWY